VSFRAELIADAGEAAAGEEFFRSRPFFAAEAVTHSLRIAAGDAELLAPLLVREIPRTDLQDAISPYGYPGLVATRATGKSERAAALDPAEIDFSETGLVSVFIRHALGPPPLARTSGRNVVQIADPALPLKTRGSDRNQVNKNRRSGYDVRLLRGTEASVEDRAGFLLAYEETMRRTGASEQYFFSSAYFERILAAPCTWLVLAHAPGGEVAAASIAALSDGFIHYYLSGSTDAHLRDSPMKNVVMRLIALASEEGLPLNLGGGIAPGDRLEEFKRGFANREEGWRTSEIVCDPAAYERLSTETPPAGGFFPAYRAPAG